MGSNDKTVPEVREEFQEETEFVLHFKAQEVGN